MTLRKIWTNAPHQRHLPGLGEGEDEPIKSNVEIGACSGNNQGQSLDKHQEIAYLFRRSMNHVTEAELP
jgi:hypothetical protein